MKKITKLFLILFACLAVLSCDKGAEGGSTSGKAILSVEVSGAEALVEVPESQVREFNVLVKANPGPSDALKLTLGIDADHVNKYNAANGTSYELLPSEAYELPSEALLLMKYNKKSTQGILKLIGTGCDRDKVYVLPVVVSMVQGLADYETPEDKVAYILFKMVAPQFSGSGTQQDPYLIASAQDVNNIGYMLNSGKYLYFKMTADVDFAGEAWKQVESKGKGIYFDGDGHKISNVVANTGLFTSLEGSVENLTIDNAKVNAGSNYAGVLANTADIGTVVKNVTITNSSVTNTGCTGGLIGSIIDTEIEDVDVQCEVSGKSMVGGLLGRILLGDLINCTASGNVTSSSYYTGGLVGTITTGTVTGCSASGNVAITGGDIYARAGGLIGQLYGGVIENCFSTGEVTAPNYWGGGFIGVIDATDDVDGVTIKACYSTGNAKFTKTEDRKMAGVGAFVGSVSGGKVNISDSYATGAVYADRWSGGFVGNIYGGELTITNSYSACDLSNVGPCFKKNEADEVIGDTHEDGIVLGALFTSEDPTKPAPVVKCTGFVAWNLSDRQFCFPYGSVALTGNYYGTEGTVSSQAQALGWSSDIWDFSGDMPVLK